MQFRIDPIAAEASFTGFRFHAFVASVVPPPLPMDFCYGFTSDRGGEYIDLATSTGGVFIDLCEQNFAPGITDVAAFLVAGST